VHLGGAVEQRGVPDVLGGHALAPRALEGHGVVPPPADERDRELLALGVLVRQQGVLVGRRRNFRRVLLFGGRLPDPSVVHDRTRPEGAKQQFLGARPPCLPHAHAVHLARGAEVGRDRYAG
jgi:hypothetical protein